MHWKSLEQWSSNETRDYWASRRTVVSDRRSKLELGDASPRFRYLRGSFELATITLAIVSVLGCSARDKPDRPRCTEVTYLRDELARCTSDSQCPAGTSCTEPEKRAACTGSPRTCCTPTFFPQIDESELIVGFGANEIEFHRKSDSTGVVSYEVVVPPQVHALSCSLFVAKPVVVGGLDGRIENAPVAIYRSHMFRIESDDDGHEAPRVLKFAITDLSDSPAKSDCSASKLADLPTISGTYPIVSTLRVGCIAYGTSEIVGATRLRNVPLADLPESQLLLTDCAGQETGDTAGRLCMAPGTLGHCVRGTCQTVMETDAGVNTTDPEDTVDGGTTTAAQSQTLPVPESSCSACTEGRLCAKVKHNIGRCMGSRCAQVSTAPWTPPLVVSDCGAPLATTDGLNCYDSQVLAYGTCFAGACRTRCVTSSHCDEANGLISTITHVCAHRRNSEGPSYIGLCLPLSWFDGDDAVAPESGDAGACGLDGDGQSPRVCVPSGGDFCVSEAKTGDCSCDSL